MAFPSRDFSLNPQKPNRFGLLKRAAGLRSLESCGVRGTTNSCPDPASTPERSCQRGGRIKREGISSLGIRVISGSSSSRRRRDSGESPHRLFNKGDSSSRRRKHRSLNRRTVQDESEQLSSVTVEASLSRSNRSPSSSPPPPLPPRRYKPTAPPEEEKDEENKEKRSKSPTDEKEDFILLHNIQKMNLEDPKNEEENTCVICMDKTKTHAYIPCGHRVVCAQCSEELKTKGVLQCIICRKKAHGIFQIF